MFYTCKHYNLIFFHEMMNIRVVNIFYWMVTIVEYVVVIFKRWLQSRPTWEDDGFLLDDGVKLFYTVST